MPRKNQAASAKRRVERDPARRPARRADQRADRERERHREQRVARVEHRRVDHHARVAQERVEAGALERRVGQRAERVGQEDEQTRKKPPKPQQDRGGVGHDLAQLPLAGEHEQDEARPEPRAGRPTAAASPPARTKRGGLVEERRGGRGVIATTAKEKSERRKARSRGSRTRSPPRRTARRRRGGRTRPSLPARARAVDRGPGAVEREAERDDQAGTAEDRHSGGVGGLELRRALRDQRVLLADEHRRPASARRR